MWLGWVRRGAKGRLSSVQAPGSARWCAGERGVLTRFGAVLCGERAVLAGFGGVLRGERGALAGFAAVPFGERGALATSAGCRLGSP